MLATDKLQKVNSEERNKKDYREECLNVKQNLSYYYSGTTKGNSLNSGLKSTEVCLKSGPMRSKAPFVSQSWIMKSNVVHLSAACCWWSVSLSKPPPKHSYLGILEDLLQWFKLLDVVYVFFPWSVLRAFCAKRKPTLDKSFNPLATGGRSIDLLIWDPESFGCRGLTTDGAALGI